MFRRPLLFAQPCAQAAGCDLPRRSLSHAELAPAFLDHLEVNRANGARSRNARIAAIRSFLRYAARHDIVLRPPTTERVLATS